MKSNFFIIIILFICILIITNCKKSEYYSFTEDEFGWILYDTNYLEIFLNSQKVEYNKNKDCSYELKYSLSFLIKHNDTIKDTITTEILTRYNKDFSKGYVNYPNIIHDEGYSQINIPSILSNIEVYITKRNNYQEVRFNIFHNDNHIFWDDSQDNNSIFFDLQSIDTAFINNKLHTDVYKFYPYETTGIKCVFFKKFKGFLKIELNNGNKIELLN